MVKESKIQGRGVFAARDFRKGEVVLDWRDYPIITKEQFEDLSNSDKKYVRGTFINFYLQTKIMIKDWSGYIKDKIKNYAISDIEFTKVRLLDWLERRNKCTLQEMKTEVYKSTNLVFAEKQEVTFQGKREIRYKCYHVYSGSKGRCYIIVFNSKIKIITVFPLGRTTLSKYGKRFK